MKGKQNNLEEKKIKFSYVPVYEAKTHIKSQT